MSRGLFITHLSGEETENCLPHEPTYPPLSRDPLDDVAPLWRWRCCLRSPPFLSEGSQCPRSQVLRLPGRNSKKGCARGARAGVPRLAVVPSLRGCPAPL